MKAAARHCIYLSVLGIAVLGTGCAASHDSEETAREEVKTQNELMQAQIAADPSLTKRD